MRERYCKCCGASVRAYKHSLNKGLVKGLYSLYKAGCVSKLADLPLTKNEFNNFQKLGYWGLIEKEVIGGEKTSRWVLTDDGLKFVRGVKMVPRWVETYRKVKTSQSLEMVGIKDIIETRYKKREEYLEDSHEL